jgi:hypothetical protein
MTAHQPSQRLQQRRDIIAELSTRALAHGDPRADALGAELGRIEDAICEVDPAAYDRLLVDWLETDQDRLQAHLTADVDDCADCAVQRRGHRWTA